MWACLFLMRFESNQTKSLAVQIDSRSFPKLELRQSQTRASGWTLGSGEVEIWEPWSRHRTKSIARTKECSGAQEPICEGCDLMATRIADFCDGWVEVRKRRASTMPSRQENSKVQRAAYFTSIPITIGTPLILLLWVELKSEQEWASKSDWANNWTHKSWKSAGPLLPISQPGIRQLVRAHEMKNPNWSRATILRCRRFTFFCHYRL